MRSLSILFLCSISLCLLAFKCSDNEQYEEFKTKSMVVSDQLEDCTANYEQTRSWLEVGVRTRYNCVKDNFSLAMLEKLTGEPVYLSGPHNKEIVFTAQGAFGHYNPKFVDQLDKAFGQMSKDETFNKWMQDFYKEELQGLCQTYYLSYNAPTDDIVKGYKEIVEKAEPCEEGFLCPPSDYLQSVFSKFASELEDQGYNTYESSTAPGFWVRRQLDGTSAQFYALLKKVLKQYDADFMAKQG